tara:strand:- start:766 stop:1341 length:576 start_codon:yes stop_codon:yes gene_type:complete
MENIKTLKNIEILKNLFYIVLGTLILALSSKIKIPFYPVPMTMQTFVVILLGLVLGWKIGLATIFLYILEGLLGLPVFSGTPEKGIGLAYLVGPTMGYLVGFFFAVFISGYIRFFSWSEKNVSNFKIFILTFIKLLIAISPIYILGMIWLSNFVGWDKVFVVGAQPFLLAELFKILLLTFLAPIIVKLKKF